VSPRPGPRRKAVTIRLKTEAVAYVDALAAAEQLTRSEMIRRLLGEAAAYRRQKRNEVVMKRTPTVAEVVDGVVKLTGGRDRYLLP
jgi:predicted transcriptional regulator